MDITPFLDLRIAPRAVFDALAERQTRVRFMVPDPAKPGEWRAVTWGTFAAEIRELALFLGTVLKTGDRGAIYAPNRVEWASAALAIQAAGGVMVPIYPASTADQVGYVASHSDAKVIFVDTPALLSRLLTTWSSLGAVIPARASARRSRGQSGSRVPCTKRTGVESFASTSARSAFEGAAATSG